MKRRALLASVGMGVSTGLAGCFGGGGNNNNQQTETEGGASTPTATPLGEAAQLSLQQIEAPPQAELQIEYTFRIHVQNSGEQPGVYRAPVSVRRSGDTEYRQVTEAMVYVEPGETQAATISIPPFTGVGSANIRIESPQNQWRVNIVGPELTSGEAFVLPNDSTITVRQIEMAVNNGGTGPNDQELSPPTDQQYVFIYLEVQNNTAAEDWTPNPEWFRVQYRDSEYSEAFISGPGRYERRIISSGSTYRGWIPYLVPASASRADLQVKYTEPTNDLIAYWQSEGAIEDSGDSGDGSADNGSSTTTGSQG
jgi:hypothetical protein